MGRANHTAILHRLAGQFGVTDGQAEANPEILYLARRGAEVADRQGRADTVTARTSLIRKRYPDQYSGDKIRDVLEDIAGNAGITDPGLKSFLKDSFPADQEWIYREESTESIAPEIIGEALAIASSDLCFLAEMKRQGTSSQLVERLLTDLPAESVGVAIRLKRNEIERNTSQGTARSNESPAVKLADHPEFREVLAKNQVEKIQLKPDTKCVAIVLAGGRSTRVRTTIPKGLIPIGNQSMLERTFSNLRQAGVDELIVGVGHRSELLRLGVDEQVRFCELNRARGVGFRAFHALQSIRDFEGTTILAYSDMPFISATSFGKLIRACERDGEFGFLISKAPHLSGKVVCSADGRPSRIVQVRFFSDGELPEVGDVGAYAFKNSQEFRGQLGSVTNDNIRGEYYFGNIVQTLAESGRQMTAIEIPSPECMTVNNPRELFQSRLAAFLGENSDPPDFGDPTVRKRFNAFLRDQFGFELGADSPMETSFRALIDGVEASAGTIFGCPGNLEELRVLVGGEIPS